MTDRYRTLEDDRFDVVVVGAGTGGLTAGALLARRGRKVLVVDQHAVAGGNATVFRRPGYEFDVGLHYLGGCHDDGVLPRLLRAAGAEPVEFLEMDPDGFDTLLFPDFTFRVPRGIEAYRQRLLERFPAERRGIDRYVALLRQLDGVMHSLSNPLVAVTTLARSWMLLRWARGTFGAFLDTVTRDLRLRAVLAAQNGNYAQPPSRASLLAGAGVALHYLEGAYYPRGGGQVISDRLAGAIEAHGGKILLLARAARILVEGGRVRGVELESRHLGRRVVHAPIVISNADLKHTLTGLVDRAALSRKTAERVERYEMSPALGAVYLGVAGDLAAEGHARTNYWIASGYDCEAGYAAVGRGEMPAEPWACVTIASLKDPGNPDLAPAGVANVQVMALAPSGAAAWGVSDEDVRTGAYRRRPAYRARKDAYARALLAAAERAIPRLAGRVVYQEVATPLTQARYTGSTGGTSYGIALTPEQFLGRRPGAGTEIRGLYLCGASCRTGHGITGVAMSGLMAAAAVLGPRFIGQVKGRANAAGRALRAGHLPPRAVHYPAPSDDLMDGAVTSAPAPARKQP
jgi:phytoene dehydrogenase-like protein